MAEREVRTKTLDLLDELEQSGYRQIRELIVGNHLEEARQVAEILAKVGLV